MQDTKQQIAHQALDQLLSRLSKDTDLFDVIISTHQVADLGDTGDEITITENRAEIIVDAQGHAHIEELSTKRTVIGPM